MNRMLQNAAEEFANLFGEEAKFYGIAPGRVEVLGNHTDYNEGFVLAAAIDRTVTVVGRPIPGPTARVYSGTFRAGSSFPVADPVLSPKEHWLNYFMAVVWQFNQTGRHPGAFEALVTGDVPLGAGLSSSAAMEMAVGNFLQAMMGLDISAMDMALDSRAAENGFVGVQCGIMDQWTSGMGREHRILLLDCRSLEIAQFAPLPDNVRLVVADTNSPHSLSTGEYNQRRDSCFRAAAACAGQFPDKKITHLRDVSLAELEACRQAMSPVDFKRAKHIVTENARALEGAEALAAGDVHRLGELFTLSQESSRNDFENSGPELDAMVEAASMPGCLGSRLTGGGFGGATINVVETDAVDTFSNLVKNRYREATGMQAAIYSFTPSAGAQGGNF